MICKWENRVPLREDRRVKTFNQSPVGQRVHVITALIEHQENDYYSFIIHVLLLITSVLLLLFFINGLLR